MKQTRIQFILTLALAFLAAFVMAANAQDAKPEKKKDDAETITLSKAQVMEIRALQAELRAAQLEAENAIPQKLKDQVKASNDAISSFWKGIGVDGTKLTEWQPVQREDGSIVLTKVKPNLPKTPETVKPE